MGDEGRTDTRKPRRRAEVEKRMDLRLAILAQARQAGRWPPPAGGDERLAQSNTIVMPSVFSGVQGA